MRISTPTSTKKTLSKRLVMGFAALASAGVVGAAGIVGAAPNKPSKTECEKKGYTNYGQCVSAFKKNGGNSGNVPPPQSGYGNGNNNTVNTEVNLDVSGNDNTIEIILNYVFG